MRGQSHNVTDPVKSPLVSATKVQRAPAAALLVDRTALSTAQDKNDALAVTTTLETAVRTDVGPIPAMARIERGGASDPVSALRRSGYRARVASIFPAVRGAGGGPV